MAPVAFGSRMRSLTPVSMMKPKSEVEQMVQEALSKEKWNAPNSLLHNLAVRTLKDDNVRHEILAPCWKLLEGSTKEWRRVLKSLALLEALLKRASPATISDIRDNSWKVKRWREEQIMEGGKDVASGIREKARFIVELCDDKELLNKERKKNHELTQKMNSARRAPEEEKENSNIMQKLPSVGGFLTPRNSNKKDVDEPSGFHAITEADMEAAAAERAGDATGRRPEFKELRNRCTAVQQATGVSAAKAMQLLKEADWDANRALYIAGQTIQQSPAPAQNANEDSDSDDSDSDSDDSDDDTPVAAKGKGGKAMGKGGKGWPQQQPPFGKGGFADGKGAGKGPTGFQSFTQPPSQAGKGAVGYPAGKGGFNPAAKGDGKGSMMMGKGSMDGSMGKGSMGGKGVMGKGGMAQAPFQSKGGWGGAPGGW